MKAFKEYKICNNNLNSLTKATIITPILEKPRVPKRETSSQEHTTS